MVARNLLIPFRRDRKRDLATGEAEALLASKVRQVLLTDGSTPRSSGELPWRTNFGAGLGLLRHQASEVLLRELAHTYVREAVARWIPGAQLASLELQQSGPAMAMRVRVRAGGHLTTADLTLPRWAATPHPHSR